MKVKAQTILSVLVFALQAKLVVCNDVKSASVDSMSLGDVHETESMKEVSEQFPGWEAFHDWMKEHERTYEDLEEKSKRMMIWLSNHEYIEKHNSQDPAPSYTLGHNQFSDLTEEEFHQRNFLGKFSPGIIRSKKSGLRGASRDSFESEEEEEEDQFEEEETLEVASSSISRRLVHARTESEKYQNELPEVMNWVDRGAVNSVKNQGMCGACWAFSAIAAIEGARFVQTGELDDLSEQQLLDCDLSDHSCMGGLMDTAFAFDMSSDGLCSEEDWPYVMHRHHIFGCRRGKAKCNVLPNTKVDSFVDVTNSTQALKEAIHMQPVSVAIQASGVDFQLYQGGVYNNDCGVELDHGVVAVGFGIEGDDEYWLIRNSWGEKWGESGYMKMAVQSNNKPDEGQCGVQSLASRPIMAIEDSFAD